MHLSPDVRCLAVFSLICRAFRLAAVLSLLLAASGALAQEPAAAPAEDADRETQVRALKELVAVLEDADRREQLVRELRLLIKAQEGAEEKRDPAAEFVDDLMRRMGRRIDAAGTRLRDALDVALEAPQFVRQIRAGIADPEARLRWLDTAWKVALVFFGGLLSRRILYDALQRRRHRSEAEVPAGRSARLFRAVALILADVLPLLLFLAVALGLLALLHPDPVTRILALALVGAFFAERLVNGVSASLLLRHDDQRPVADVGSETGAYVYLWIRRFSVVAIYGWFAVRAARLLEFSGAVLTLVEGSVGLLLSAMAVVLILQNREPVAAWIRGSERGWSASWHAIRVFLAGIAPGVMVLAVIAVYGVWLFSIEGGFAFLARALFLTIVIIGVARLLSFLVGRAVDRGFRIRPELKLRYPMLEKRVNRYVPLIRRLLGAVIFIAALTAIMDAWGLGALDWFESDTGRLVLGKAGRILFVVLMALLIWELLSLAIFRYLDRRDARTGERLATSARARTLLPLFQNFMLVTVGIIAAMSILSEIGLNIAPLLAGAGVVGIAIGFGAQSLVKDVITGIFIIIEDSIAIGDIIDVGGGHAGVLEGMTLRTVRLRDLDGIVHVVPFGNIADIRNMTKEFSYSVLDIRVAYREDVDKVIEVVKAVAAGMQEDPDFRGRILAPLEVLGVEALEDSAVYLRARFRTQTAAQWGVRREFYRRLKQAFDEHGIEFPFPHRTIYFGADGEGKAQPVNVRMEGSRGPSGTDKGSD